MSYGTLQTAEVKELQRQVRCAAACLRAAKKRVDQLELQIIQLKAQRESIMKVQRFKALPSRAQAHFRSVEEYTAYVARKKAHRQSLEASA